MKKLLSIIFAVSLVLILSLSCSVVSMAESYNLEHESNIKDKPVGEFNYSILEGMEGYYYNKFDKCWSCYTVYDDVYSDADFLIGIKLFGVAAGNNLEEVDLKVKIVDKEGNPIEEVKAMDFLIDDVMYSYSEMPEEKSELVGTVVLYDSGYELVKAFAEAKEVSVRLFFFGDYYRIIDLDMDLFSTTLQAFCQTIVNNNIWDYYISDPFLSSFEEEYPLTITR